MAIKNSECLPGAAQLEEY